MVQLRSLRFALLTAPLVISPIFTSPVLAAAADLPAPGTTASLLEALSLISGGMLVAPMLAPEVTQDGTRFRVHIPVPKLTSPPDAAIEVAATALDSGAWDITSFTLPKTGTLVTTMPAPNTPKPNLSAPNRPAIGAAPAGIPAAEPAPAAPPLSMRFTIGQQSSHARVDPTLSVPSQYAMDLRDIGLHIDGAASMDLTFTKATADGTITGDADHHMTNRSRGKVEDGRLTVSNPAGAPFTLSLRSAEALYDLDGLDRAQAARWHETTRALAENRPEQAAAVPGTPRSPSPLQHQQLLALIDASKGLLTGINIDETFAGLHFEAAGGTSGDIREVHFVMAGGARDDRMAGHYDMALDDLKLTGVPPQFAQYVPRRIAFKTAVSGIPVEKLRTLLRESLDAPADAAEARSKAITLLNEPGAHAGIEALLIEMGPLLIQGSGQVHPLPDGSAGFDVHLTAHGVDAMLALIQADPKSQQMMPMLFLAKGMAKPEGDTLVWNIAFAGGVVTINGVPMGQRPGGPPGGAPGGSLRGARPPGNR